MNGGALKFTRDVKLGVKNLMLHKLRSFLTMLGLVFGVGSVIAMLAIGEGASESALEQIRKLGSRNVILSARKPPEEKSSASHTSWLSIYGLLYADAERISATIPTVASTVPVKSMTKVSRFLKRALDLRVIATTERWFDLVRRPVLAGRTLTARDLADRAAVAVLTEYGARRLLANEHAVGESLTIDGNVFEVVGIVRSEASGDEAMETPDNATDVYIPLSSACERYGDLFIQRTQGSMVREQVELHQILVEVDAEENVERTAAALRRSLETFHRRQDYAISVPLQLLRQAEATKRTFSIVLGAIAGISLLVGGIGIMNIMLASVTERTREIGIRRAIGARRNQITLQFLIESLVLSLMGGLVGIGLGLLIPFLVTVCAGMPTVVTAWSLVLSLGISVGVGVGFGIYPAIRASRLDPIVALRHE